MKNDFEALIDRYINYEMTEEERRAFEKMLEEDSALKEQFLAIHFLSEGEQILHERGLKEDIKNLSQEEIMAIIKPSTNKKSKLRTAAKRNYIYPAISILSLAAVILLILLFNNSSGNYLYPTSDIYSNYFSEAPEVEYARSGTELSEEVIEMNGKIIAYYTEKEYQKVVSFYEENMNNNSFSGLPQQSLILIAYSLIEGNKEKQAISILHTLNDSDYAEEAEWLLLGAYLKMDEREEALGIAQRIVEQPDSYYAKDALSIRKELNAKSGK